MQVGRKLYILTTGAADYSPFSYRIKINCNKSFMVHKAEIISLFTGHKTKKKIWCGLSFYKSYKIMLSENLKRHFFKEEIQIDDQWAHEKMLNLTNYWRTTNQNY